MSTYKFENFIERDFPIYSSRQKGVGNIVVPHYHGEIELIKISSGEAECFIDTKKFLCKKGDIIFIPPFCVHSIISKNKDTKTVGAVFNLSILSEKLFNDLKDTLCKDYIDNNIFNSKDLTTNELGKSIETINKIYSQLPLKKALLYAEIIKICYYLNEKYNVLKKSEKGFSKISPVVKYINENYYQELSLFNLSKIINVSENHLIRLFKSATNKTPIKYINDVRIEIAMKLLINSNYSITEISQKVGFSSVNYMNKVFKDTLNTTPSEFKRTKQYN